MDAAIADTLSACIFLRALPVERIPLLSFVVTSFNPSFLFRPGLICPPGKCIYPQFLVNKRILSVTLCLFFALFYKSITHIELISFSTDMSVTLCLVKCNTLFIECNTLFISTIYSCNYIHVILHINTGSRPCVIVDNFYLSVILLLSRYVYGIMYLMKIHFIFPFKN